MIAAAILTLVVIAYRVILGTLGAPHLDWLHNFSPLAAVALCGAIFFPRKVAIAFPLAALFVSDVLLNVVCYHIPAVNLAMLPQYLALGMVCALGWMLRRQPQAWKVLVAALASSILFYVVTNTGAWLASPLYAKTAAGWVQALTTGLPGYPSTLVFYRHTLASDLIFTGLFLICVEFGKRHSLAVGEEESHESLRTAFARRLR
jgi:hypothetical protein